MSADLVFEAPPASGADLVFGESDTQQTDAALVATGEFDDLSACVLVRRQATIRAYGSFDDLAGGINLVRGRELEICASFEHLSASVSVARDYPAGIDARFDGLDVVVDAVYDARVERPEVGQTAASWSVATKTEEGSLVTEQIARQFPVGWQDKSQIGAFLVGGFEHRLPGVFAPDEARYGALIQEGCALDFEVGSVIQDGERSVRTSGRGWFQDGTPVRYASLQRFQDGGHGSRAWRKVQHQDATQHKGRMHTGSPKSGTLFSFARTARFQDGMVPPPGISKVVVPVVPPVKVSADLLFVDLFAIDANLVFGKTGATQPDGQTVVVPIRRVYFVINHVSLRRISDGAVVPTLSMSLSLDVSSWTWGFDASLPGVAQGLVEPTADGPVELEAVVNGAVFRVLAENISRERTFGQVSIKVSGRGCNAVLDAPYSAQQVFRSLQMRTSQQLMEDVLTFNGIPLGYGIDYGLDPWEVPARVFNHQGTYITALSALAQAGGGYLIPHRANKSFAVRHLYPVKPWEVAAVDVVLPADVVVRESISWKEMPAYNRVYVSGQEQGVLGRVTRAGTAGEILAPMVTDALITTASAARQRGLAVLGNTGRKLEVGLSLPVLPATGIIDPGTYVQYLDGSISRIGIVRSTQVSVGFPEVTQTLGVEVHA